MPEHVCVPAGWRAVGIAVASIVALSCGNDPHQPDPGPGPALPVSLGDTISGALPGGAPEALYSFRVTQPAELAVFGYADGSVVLTVVDSAFEVQNPGAPHITRVYPHSVDGSELMDRRTSRFPAEPGRTYLIRAEHTQTPVDVRFRFLIYPVNRAPEHRAAAIVPGEIVEGEWLENSADIDEFQLQADAGTELIGFIQGSDSLGQSVAGLTVLGPTGADLGSVAHLGPQTDIEAQPTGRFVVPAEGTYRFAVQGGAEIRFDQPIAGGYRILARVINRGPEHWPAIVELGDTVAGVIDHVGDVDEFTLSGQPGQQFNLFLQALNESPNAGSEIEIEGGIPAQDFFEVVQSTGSDTSLYGQASKRVALPEAGMVTLRVLGLPDQFNLHRGPYRFFVYPIDPAPEDAPSSLTLGQAVEDAIELPGDVDEYQLTVAGAGQTNLVLEPLGGAAGQLELTWMNAAGEFIGGLRLFESEPLGIASGTFEIAAGEYRLRVQGESSGEGYRGGYRLSAHAIAPGPESSSASALVDVAKTGESIFPLGDYDRFTLNAARGDVLTIWFQPLGAPSDRGIGIGIRREGVFDGIAGTGQTFGGDSVETGRFIIRESGAYEITVSGDGRFPGNQGAYRFTVHRLDTNPEQVSQGLATGETVSTEALDVRGDVDEFVLSAAPNTELQATLQGAPGGTIRLDVERPTTYDSLKSTVSSGFLQATGLFLMPAGGQLRLRVYELSEFIARSPYTLSVFAIQRAPESVPAALPTGVVVTGEAVSPVGDVDEFAFDGATGETATLYLNTPNGFDISSPALLELLAPGSETVLGSVSSGNPAPSIFDQSTGPVTLPVTGSYRVRVRATLDHSGTGNYQVYLER